MDKLKNAILVITETSLVLVYVNAYLYENSKLSTITLFLMLRLSDFFFWVIFLFICWQLAIKQNKVLLKYNLIIVIFLTLFFAMINNTELGQHSRMNILDSLGNDLWKK